MRSLDTAPYVGAHQIYQRLGVAIAKNRTRRGLTQQNLADAIGISRASVANIERGEQRVFLDQVVAIASFFELRGVDDLLRLAQAELVAEGKVRLSGDKLNRSLTKEVKDLVDALVGDA